VEQLEVLLLLHGTPQVGWTTDRIARELYSTPSSIKGRLGTLLKQDLVVAAGDPAIYHYQPGTPALHTAVQRLAETYRDRRVAVVTLIASKPMENVRAFSDAFRLRKKDQD
jgi:hypothetical protein